MGAWEVEICLDSQLVVSQVQHSFEAQDSRMKEYLWVVKQVMSQFTKAKVVQVAWGQNRHADTLAKLASSMTEDVPRIIKVELIAQLSIYTAIGVAVVSTSVPCWMDPIMNYLTKDQVPDDEKEANWVRRVAARFWLLVDHKLYRRSFGQGEGGRIFYVCTLRRLMNFWLSYTMGCASAM